MQKREGDPFQSVWKLHYTPYFGRLRLLFNFYLRFSVWGFTEITSFISFPEGISSITKKQVSTVRCRFQLGNFKYNKNKKQKSKQNFLTQWILGFIEIHFFNRNQVFLNFQWKKAVRKLSGVNFNYTYRLHLVLVIRISFDKNLIYPETQAARILMKQNIIIICS